MNTNQSNPNQLKMSQNMYQLNHTQAYSDYNRTYQQDHPQHTELCGCAPNKIVPLMKTMLVFIMIGGLIGFILSIVGACYGGSNWLGDQPPSTYGLFITNILLCAFIFILALLTFIQLQVKKSFDLTIKIELTIFFVFVLLACSLAGGIIINTIDQTSSIAYSCSQVYSMIWPTSVLTASQTASQTFCSSSCPCDYTSASQATYPLSGYFNTAGPVNAFGCSSYVPLSQGTVNLLKQLEQNWNCAGICDVSDRYQFTDVINQSITFFLQQSFSFEVLLDFFLTQFLLIREVNRGQPNSQQSCFSYASQQLYPLKNLFLGGDFAISIIQMFLLLFLLKMKSFLERDDVRLASGMKTAEQEKQELYAASILGDNQQNGSVVHYQLQDQDQSAYQQQQQHQDQNESIDYQQQHMVVENIENQNQPFTRKQTFNQSLAQQMSMHPANQQPQRQDSIPQFKQNTVVPIKDVLYTNAQQQSPQKDQTKSDLEYQQERDQQKYQPQYNKQPTFAPQQTSQVIIQQAPQQVTLVRQGSLGAQQSAMAPQQQLQIAQLSQTVNSKNQTFKSDFYDDDQNHSPVQRSTIQTPQKNNFLEKKKTIIEHPPVNNLFDDDLAQNRNKNNLNNSSISNPRTSSHPLAQLQKSLQPNSFQQENQSPIKRQPQGGLSVLANSGNQTLNRQGVQPSVIGNDRSDDPNIHNVDLVKPKSNGGSTNSNRPQNNFIALNFDQSAQNSAVQLNNNPAPAFNQESSANGGSTNTNKKFFSKQNQNNF